MFARRTSHCIFRRRAGQSFSTDTFAGVLSQLAKHEIQHAPQVDKYLKIDEDLTTALEPEIVYPLATKRGVVEDPFDPEPVDSARITEDVTVAIESLLDSQNVWTDGLDPDSASLDDESLTPAQRFYLENKQLLLKRAAEYSVGRATDEFEKATQDMQDEWAFYRDPVVRPIRGHLWDDASVHSNENVSDESGEWTLGKFPEIDEIVHLLYREKVCDIATIDLDMCNRRDIGEWAIIGTVQTAVHGSRVGNLARRSINKLNLEHMKCFINSIPGQEWVVVRLGSVIVHLMTQHDRNKYNLEDMYISNEPLDDQLMAVETS